MEQLAVDELYSSGFVSVAGLAKLGNATYSEAAQVARNMGVSRDQLFLVSASFWGPSGVCCATVEVEDLSAVGHTVCERFGEVSLLGWDVVGVKRRQQARGAPPGAVVSQSAESALTGASGLASQSLEAEQWGSQLVSPFPGDPAAKSPASVTSGAIPPPPSSSGPALLFLRAAQQECELWASDLASITTDKELLAQNLEARNKRFRMNDEFVAKYPRLLKLPSAVASTGARTEAAGEGVTRGMTESVGNPPSHHSAGSLSNPNLHAREEPDGTGPCGVDDLGQYHVEMEKETFIARDGKVTKRLVAKPVRGSRPRKPQQSRPKPSSQYGRQGEQRADSDSSMDAEYDRDYEDDCGVGDALAGAVASSTDALFSSGAGDSSAGPLVEISAENVVEPPSPATANSGSSTTTSSAHTNAAPRPAPAPPVAPPIKRSTDALGPPPSRDNSRGPREPSPLEKKVKKPDDAKKANAGKAGKKGMQGFDITRFLQKK